MKLIYVYDDKIKVNRERTGLENTRCFKGDMDFGDIWTEVITYVDES